MKTLPKKGLSPPRLSDRKGSNPGCPKPHPQPTFPIRHRALQQEGLPARASGPGRSIRLPALGLDVCPSRCDFTCCRRNIYKTLTLNIKAARQTQGWAAGGAPRSQGRPHRGGYDSLSHTHTPLFLILLIPDKRRCLNPWYHGATSIERQVGLVPGVTARSQCPRPRWKGPGALLS